MYCDIIIGGVYILRHFRQESCSADEGTGTGDCNEVSKSQMRRTQRILRRLRKACSEGDME